MADLRVDVDPEPISRLEESLRYHRAYGIFFESVFAPGLVTGAEPVLGDDLERALEGLAATQEALGDDPEPTAWQGVLLLRAGRIDEGCAFLARAIAVPTAARRSSSTGSPGSARIPLGSADILRRSGQ